MFGRKDYQDSAVGLCAARIACWAAFLCILAWFHSIKPWCTWTRCLGSMDFLPQWMHLFIRFTSFKLLNALASTSEQDWGSWIPLEKHLRGGHSMFSLPLPQTWAPGNTGGCPAPQQPGRTCDSPSGYRPHTGAPLHRPAGTKHRHVWACPRIFTQARVTIPVQESKRCHWYRCAYTNQTLNIATNDVYTRYTYLTPSRLLILAWFPVFLLTWHNLSRQDCELLTAAAVVIWEKKIVLHCRIMRPLVKRSGLCVSVCMCVFCTDVLHYIENNEKRKKCMLGILRHLPSRYSWAQERSNISILLTLTETESYSGLPGRHTHTHTHTHTHSVT